MVKRKKSARVRAREAREMEATIQRGTFDLLDRLVLRAALSPAEVWALRVALLYLNEDAGAEPKPETARLAEQAARKIWNIATDGEKLTVFQSPFLRMPLLGP